MNKTRSKGKFKSSVATNDFYKYYKTNIEKDSVYDISKKEYTAILKDINKEIMQLIITTNFEFQMIPNMGNLSIRKAKSKLKLDKEGNLIKSKIPVDYGKTNALWRADPEAKKKKKLVYFLNDHTEGFRFKFFWDKNNCKVTNKAYYNFRASRDNNRAINVAINTIDHLDYFEFRKNLIIRKEK